MVVVSNLEMRQRNLIRVNFTQLDHYQEILLQRAQQNLFINDDCILVYSFKNTKNPLFKKIRFDFALSLFYI